MALPLDQIRTTADRVAASHGLEIVDLEFAGSGKHRALRVFVEKDAAGRQKLKQLAANADANPGADPDICDVVYDSRHASCFPAVCRPRCFPE